MFPRILEFPRPQRAEGGAPEWAPLLGVVAGDEVLSEPGPPRRRASPCRPAQRAEPGGGSGPAAAPPPRRTRLGSHALGLARGRAPAEPQEACAARGVRGARGACRRRGARCPGEAPRAAAAGGGGRAGGGGEARPPRGWAAPRLPAPGSRLRSRSPGRFARAAVGGACGDWRAGGEVGSTLFFMLMREWGLSVFTLRREPPPFIHPHGPWRCCRRRPACAFAPLRALGRGRGRGDGPRRGAAARAPREAPWRGGPAGRPHPRPGASGRSKAEAGGEAGARARGGRGEHEALLRILAEKKVFPSGQTCLSRTSQTWVFPCSLKSPTE
ncbi:unnamed protein product [Nyctereutes procyonoides]|uniref:(raccoon dog) hypothetical protein n=1 Tax=Nyctereutes procyonoides TaxID=34880 RepID=A0A811YTW9_NYCPR|nr:unnamed protein product [Nyctereutes procyonoides]